jgi:hypothetical protein
MEVKETIIEKTELQPEVHIEEHYEVLEKEKKGLGTKIKELFTGKHEHMHQDDALKHSATAHEHKHTHEHAHKHRHTTS